MAVRGYPAWMITGGVIGAISFAVAAVVSMHFVAYDALPGISTGPEEWKIRMWYFYNAHGVEITQEVSYNQETIQLAEPVNLLEQNGREKMKYVEWAPAAVLGFFGMVLGSTSRGLISSSISGASQVVGYAPLFVAGSFVFSQQWDYNRALATVGPDKVTATMFGLGYPIAFGALGGVVGYIVSRVV